MANNPEWEDETVCVQYDDDEESPTFEQFVPGQPYCLAAFMLWGAPVMCSVVMLIFGGALGGYVRRKFTAGHSTMVA